MAEDHGSAAGPLAGVRIVEFAGLGPAPYGAMVLADLGAEIIRLDRPGGYPPPDPSLTFEDIGAAAIANRNRRVVRVDLKSDAGRDLALRLIGAADALIEGYRPGVMEKLGLGPEACRAVNPALVFARMTGWGQDGPLAQAAGHDLNYIGVAGVLSLFGTDGEPPPGAPPLVGDMAGGLFMALGLVAAVLEARRSGQGQVVDAAIVDTASALAAMLKGLQKAGAYGAPAGRNTLDGGRHYYRTYRCADGGYVAVGAIEPAFRKILLERLGLLDDPRFLSADAEDDAYCTERLAARFAEAPRDHWAALFDGTDGCVTPMLSMEEAETHPQALERAAFATIDGVAQPQPAPRFSRTPCAVRIPPAEASRSDPDALAAWGLRADEIAALREAGVVS